MHANQSLYRLFRMNPQAFPGVNPGVFNADIAEENAQIPLNRERTREAGILAEMDRQASAADAADRERTAAEQTAQQQGYRNVAEATRTGREDVLARVLYPGLASHPGHALEDDGARDRSDKADDAD